MAISKTSNNNKAGNQTNRKGALPLITTLSLLLVALAVGASGWWSYQTLVVAVEQQRLQELVTQQAQRRAHAIRAYIREQQKQLNAHAHRDVVVQAVAGEKQPHSGVLRSLQKAYSEAESFRLLDLQRHDRLTGDDSAQPDGEALGFTELDMIYRAEQRKPVAPEARKVGKEWQLLFITPVASDDKAAPVGTLLVILSADTLKKQLAALDPQLGRTSLLRRSGGKATVLAVGSGGSGDKVTTPVPDSVWQVQFQASPMLAAQVEESPWLLLAGHLLAAVVLLGLTWWITGRLDPQRRRATAAQVAAVPLQGDALEALQLREDDRELLGLAKRDVVKPAPQTITERADVPAEVFRAYDIRGRTADQITPVLAELVGRAVASEALAAGDNNLFIARDGRLTSEALTEAVIRGVLSTGCNAIDLGLVPTPLLYYATCALPDSNSGIMITASHNPAAYNGFKMVIGGRTLVDEDVQRIRQRILSDDLCRGEGEKRQMDVSSAYIDRILADVALAGDVKVVIDAGNGVTGTVAPQLFTELGCDVEPLFCELDGSFPNHDPDPTIADNLRDLIQRVQASDADLGIALDGDGDRLVLVTPAGEIIWPDRLLMLFAKDIVSRNPGADVLFDVKCTRELNQLVSSYGGRPIMWKAGHSQMKSKMLETGALLGGELSGHIFIKDRWYGFDDGMYAAARLLEIMTLRDQDADSLFASFPLPPSTPEILIPVPEAQKFRLVEQLIKEGDFQNGNVITIDGLRVDFPKGWGLVRASNTSAALTLRFEAESESVLQQLQGLFRRELLKVDTTLNIPF